MKYKKSFFVCMILLVILSAGVAFADENATIGEDTLESPAEEPILEDGNIASENQVNGLKELVENEDYSVSIDNWTNADLISVVKVENMPWDASGNISISIDGKEKYNQMVQVSGNALILNDLNLAAADHNVLINYSGDGKYAGFVKTGTISPIDVYCYDTFREDGELSIRTTDSKSNIKVVIDNKVVYNKAGQGYIDIDLDKYSVGIHSYEVFYAGKSIRKGTFNHVNFDVYCWDDITYGSSAKIWIDLPKKGTGFAQFKGKQYPFEFEKDEEGYDVGYIVVSGLDAGENIIEFHYLNQVRNFSLFVSPNVTMPTILQANVGSKLIFNASSNFNGNLILSGFMNGKYNVKNGYVEVNIPKLSKGVYPLNVKYENYAWDYKVKVLDETPGISDYNVDGSYYPTEEYGSTLSVNVELPYDAVGNLSVEIKYEGESKYKLFKTVPVEDGEAQIALPSDRVGEYSFIAYFKGNYEVESLYDSISIIPKVSSSVIKYGDTGKFTVEMGNISDAKLAISIEYGVPIAEFDLNGNNVITIDKNFVYKAKSLMKIALNEAVKYGNSPYITLYASIYTKDAVFSEFGFLDVNFASKITGLANVNTQYSAGKTLTLKVYDIFGNLVKSGETVKIKIGKKTFTAKISKGVVKFKIPNTVTPGKYTISATYKDFKVSKKITVKQILSVKTVKVKKSAKKLVLTATLKKVNGKYIKGKYITFKFNGKTYKAKTNKKGVAKVTIKKSVLKKLKVGKKVKYQATYLKDTVKKSVKVKK